MKYGPKTSKLMIASSAAVSTGFLIPLSGASPAGIMIPLYALSISGTASYIYLLANSLESQKNIPPYITTLMGLLIASSFSVATALSYGNVFDLGNPFIISTFILEAIMLATVLAPNELLS